MSILYNANIAHNTGDYMHINVQDPDQTFGEWLQQLLEEYKIKPIKFAEISNISRSSISRYLSEGRIPKVQKQDMIIDAICKISDMQKSQIEQKVLWHCHVSRRRRQG